MDKFKVEITLSHEFSTQDINDLVVTALEGGINYWCGKAVINKDRDGKIIGVSDEDQEKVNYASDVIGYGGSLTLHDAESSDKWKLTRDSMLKGIKMFCEDRCTDPAELIDNHDAGDADSIVQYALFDELVYG
jgi:hypothetical protein